MWINEDRASVRVILAGGMLPEVYEQLWSAFDEIEGTAGPSTDVNESERGTFDRNDDVLPPRTFRSQTAALPPVIDLAALEREEIELRAAERPPTSPLVPVMDLPEVRFESGEQVRVMGVIYVGRDPMRIDANGTVVERFAVADATDTVNKTHFAMGASLSGLWVEDLFSTTGTSVGADALSARRVKPMERVPVAISERIFFGEQSAVVVVDRDRAMPRRSDAAVPVSTPSSRV